jgi:hypothetical protein
VTQDCSTEDGLQFFKEKCDHHCHAAANLSMSSVLSQSVIFPSRDCDRIGSTSESQSAVTCKFVTDGADCHSLLSNNKTQQANMILTPFTLESEGKDTDQKITVVGPETKDHMQVFNPLDNGQSLSGGGRHIPSLSTGTGYTADTSLCGPSQGLAEAASPILSTRGTGKIASIGAGRFMTNIGLEESRVCDVNAALASSQGENVKGLGCQVTNITGTSESVSANNSENLVTMAADVLSIVEETPNATIAGIAQIKILNVACYCQQNFRLLGLHGKGAISDCKGMDARFCTRICRQRTRSS